MEKPLILIVDDIAQNLQLLGATLNKKGYEIAIAKNGKQALSTIDKIPPDLVLLDIMMPEMDGYEVCKVIKSNPKTDHIPIIFLTGKTETDDVIKAFEVGASDYVTKPFHPAEILARVQTQLDLKRSRDELAARNQELKELNANKDTFFSIIAHDLRNPLSGLLNLAEMLEEDYDTMDEDEVKQFIRLINDSAQQFHRLLNNLLQWARFEMGKMEFNPEILDLNEIVESNIKLFSMNATEKSIDIKNHIPENLTVQGDPNMLDTILRNILSNGIKFTDKGGKIEISHASNPEEHIIKISDTGMGMESDQLEDLFSIENMESTDGTNEEKGTGLGLVLCKQMIEKNGGSINVESEPGEGTTFSFTLPKKNDE